MAPSPFIFRFIVLLLGPLLFAQVCLAEKPQLMLAAKWPVGADPTGWWMSEKFDGIRGYWDGKQMLTRGGKPVALPPDWAKKMPDFALDGELWAGRGRFSETSATVRDGVPGEGWHNIHYLIFDAPGTPGPFEKRLERVDQWLSKHPAPQIRLIEQHRCRDAAHLQQFLDEVEAKGGEGVILRAAGSDYTQGRSKDLCKLKRFDDDEAVVVGYKPGEGKYANLVGALLVRLPDGRRFAVGSGLSDEERRQPPPVGSTITFKYQGWTKNGKPRFPVYWRIRQQVGH